MKQGKMSNGVALLVMVALLVGFGLLLRRPMVVEVIIERQPIGQTDSLP